MAENVLITPGSGDTVAADDISSVKYQRIKVTLGADGVNDGDLSSANPMPVTQSGVATSAKQDTGNTSLASLDTKAPALGQALAAASVPVVLPAAQITTLTPPAAITNYANETGGNLAAVAASASVLDDWDESDRAKVNPIVGQAGVAAGAGTTSATTQRVVLPTDQTAIPITDNAGSLTVDGSVTVTQGTGSNLHAVLDSGTLTTLTTLTGTTSLTPGTGATNLGKAEDAPHTSGDVGVMALAVRNDSGTVLAGTDGDYHAITVDATGAVRVDLNGTVSTNNSSTSTLLANATFTGTADDCLNYNEIRVSIIASHASAADGLSIQQSSDGTNWDMTDTYTIPATTGKTYSIPRQARYVRIVYTNGGTNQSSFRLQTILNRLGSRVSSQRAADGYTNETDLEQNQAFLMGYNGTTWDRLRSDTTNGLDVDVTRLPALVAGAAIVGKVGIDQTTVGTTNAVSVAQLGANTVSTGNGASGTGVLRVAQVNDGTGVLASISTSVTPGTAAANLGKAEDAGHTTGDTGIFTLGVRNDTLADVTNTTADYSQQSTDLKGRVMVAGAPRALKTPQQTTITSSTSETTVLTAVGSTFLDVYGVIIANTSATACDVTFKDATAGTTRFNIYVPAGDTRGFMLPIDAAHPQSATNNNWTATCGTSVASIKITMLAVKMV